MFRKCCFLILVFGLYTQMAFGDVRITEGKEIEKVILESTILHSERKEGATAIEVHAIHLRHQWHY